MSAADSAPTGSSSFTTSNVTFSLVPTPTLLSGWSRRRVIWHAARIAPRMRGLLLARSFRIRHLAVHFVDSARHRLLGQSSRRWTPARVCLDLTALRYVA